MLKGKAETHIPFSFYVGVDKRKRNHATHAHVLTHAQTQTHRDTETRIYTGRDTQTYNTHTHTQTKTERPLTHRKTDTEIRHRKRHTPVTTGHTVSLAQRTQKYKVDMSEPWLNQTTNQETQKSKGRFWTTERWSRHGFTHRKQFTTKSTRQSTSSA